MVTSPATAADPTQAMTLTVSSRWFDPKTCPPPLHVEFFALYFADGDYHVNHCIRNGEDDSMMENMRGWWPSPPLPKEAVDGFTPHDKALGKKALAGLKKWFAEQVCA